MWVPKINIKDDKKRSILFVPAMLDMHFSLIKYAFYSKKLYPCDNDRRRWDYRSWYQICQ